MKPDSISGILLLYCAFGLGGMGCGGGGPREYKVTGSVISGGQPQPGVNVGFVPLDTSQSGNTRGAKTNIEGKFEVRLRPGSYTVLLTKLVDSKGNVPVITDPEKQDWGQIEANAQFRQAFPPAYNNPSLSPFKAEIKDGDTELPPFDVKKK